MKPIRAAVVARRSSRCSSLIERLELRQLFAGLPPLSNPFFAAADDTYTITVTPTGGSGNTTPFSSSLTSLSFSFTNSTTVGSTSPGKASFGDFTFTAPIGPNSVRYFQMLTVAQRGDVVITDFTHDGRTRMVWTLTPAFVTKTGQTVAPDGSWQDNVTVVYGAIRLQYYDVTQSPQPLLTDVNWDVLKNVGTVPPSPIPASSPLNTNYLATSPAVNETLEFATGQIPVSNTSITFRNNVQIGATGGSKAVALDDTFDTIDGRSAIGMVSYLFSGQHFRTAVYTRRDPATGVAAQRFRISTAFVTNIAISDSIFDNEPRKTTVTLDAGAYTLVNYAYTNGGTVQTQTFGGWDFVGNRAINDTPISAHVAPPLDPTVTSPIDAVTFRFTSPVTLTTASFLFDGLTLTSAVTLSSADSGKTLTLAGLAAQQVSDGRYSVKLLANKINDLSADSSTIGTLFIGSAGRSWTLDRTSPAALSSAFVYDGPAPTPYTFDFGFSEAIVASATDGQVPVLIRRASDNGLVTTAMAMIGSDGLSLNAHLTATLADGRYRATVPAGSVRDAAGNLLASDVNLPFFVLAGDVDHDATVGFSDLLTLAKHYGQTGLSFSEGNVDYSADGSVTFSDLLILAKHYGTTLPAAPAAAEGLLGSSTPVRRRTSAADGIVA